MADRARAQDLDRAASIASGLLVISLMLGGGGSPAPLLELALQGCTALAALALLAAAPAAVSAVPAAAWRIAALIAILPLLQLIPLPPNWWQSLPGREVQIAALDLTSSADSWRPLSLSSSRTLASLIAAASAVLCLVLTSALDRRGRSRLIATIAGVGLLSLLVGAAQLSGGTGSFFRFFDPHEIYLTAFQANHNSTGDVLLIAMLALAAWARHWLDRGTIQPSALQLGALIIIADGLLILALVLTGSRAGLAMLPIALVFQFLILQPDARFSWPKAGLCAVSTFVLGTAAYFALRNNRVIDAIVQRFDFSREFRPELWRDSLFALGQYWPAGSGQGTFVPVMMAVERLEVIDPTLPNRAHNDYLELLIGGGLPGAVVLAIGTFLILQKVRQALREPPAGSRNQVLFACGALLILAVHSLVDYPLRSMALAAVAATAIGLLIPARQTEPSFTAKGSHP